MPREVAPGRRAARYLSPAAATATVPKRCPPRPPQPAEDPKPCPAAAFTRRPASPRVAPTQHSPAALQQRQPGPSAQRTGCGPRTLSDRCVRKEPPSASSLGLPEVGESLWSPVHWACPGRLSCSSQANSCPRGSRSSRSSGLLAPPRLGICFPFVRRSLQTHYWA